MIRRIQQVGFLLAALAAPAGALAQNALTSEQWREDLRTLAEELPERHRNAFDPLRSEATPEEFERAVADLDRRIPELADHEVIVGLAALVAMLGDGHSRLTLPQDPAVGWSRAHTDTPPPSDSSLFFHHLPVRFDLYPEGLFVRAATSAHRDLIGARVLEVGTTPTDSALQAVRPLVHFDNELGFRLRAPTRLVIPEVLHALGLTAGITRTRLVVRTRSGERREVILSPVPLFDAPAFLEARELASTPVPLSERNPDAWYWLEYLPSERALYVHVDRIASREDESMRLFAGRVAAIVRDSAVQKLILDLRSNAGGNRDVARPLFRALAGSEIDRPGRLLVLIGRETFSAAQNHVNDLEALTNALFVGEPTGSTPSHFGDSRRFRLPNSNLTVRASTIYYSNGEERRSWTEPHIAVEPSAEDHFAHRDPGLATALAYEPPEDPAMLVRDVRARSRGWWSTRATEWHPTMRLCWTFAADYRIPRGRAEAGVAACGFLLIEEGQTDLAIQWFRATLDFLPASATSYYGLGRAYLATGERAEAVEALETALKLDPNLAPAAALLREESERVDRSSPSS